MKVDQGPDGSDSPDTSLDLGAGNLARGKLHQRVDLVKLDIIIVASYHELPTFAQIIW